MQTTLKTGKNLARGTVKMVYNCDVCGMDLKNQGKTQKTYLQSYKVLVVTKVEKWKCPTGCELKGINGGA